MMQLMLIGSLPKKEKIGEIYNIGGNKSIKVGNVLKKLVKFANKKSSAKRIKNCYVLKMLLYKYLLL